MKHLGQPIWATLLAAVCATALLLTACGQTPPSATVEAPASGTQAATAPVGDPCDKNNITNTVKDYTDLTREFDDTSYVASFTPQAQLADVILKLQDTRRRVQALDAPDCLKNLRKYQVDYMNGVITALVHFLGGAKGDQVQAEIAATRALRAKYDRELATVLGITFVAPTGQPQPSAAPGTPTGAATDANTPTSLSLTTSSDTTTPDGATGTPAPTDSATTTPAAATVTVTQRANLRRGPGTDFQLVATLNANETATAVGRTNTGDWIQVLNSAGPDGKAWLLASLVTLNVPVDQLPVVNPP